MSICGYNDKIGDGLRLLVEGMIEALDRKTKASPIAAVLDREVTELEAMIGTLSKADHCTLAQMFVGLNILARALFEQVRQMPGVERESSWADECRSVCEAFTVLLSRTENHYEQSEQRRSALTKRSVERLAEQLALWALRHSEEDPILQAYRVAPPHLSGRGPSPAVGERSVFE
jgi:hypothetical protein